MGHERANDAYFDVALEEFVASLPLVSEDLARRSYVDCAAVVWNGIEYVGYEHRTMSADAGMYGVGAWCLIDQDARATTMFARDHQFEGERVS